MKRTAFKIFSAFLSIILVICALPITSNAYLNDFNTIEHFSNYYPESPEFKYGDLKVKYGRDGLSIIDFSDSEAEKYTIPEQIKGIPVTELHDIDINTEELTIPDSVRRIENFKTEAQTIKIGNNVEIIEDVELDRCSNLSELIFPESLKELFFESLSQKNSYSSLKKIRFAGKYQSFKFDYFPKSKLLEFPDETEIIFEGRPCYDIWFYLKNAGYKLVDNGDEFICVKDEAKQFETCGDYQYYLDENGYAVISKYNGIGNDSLNIPATLNGHTVIKIGDNAFDNRSEIPSEPLKEVAVKESGFAFREVTIPETVVEIGDFAFSHCKSLQTVNIPDSVEIIGYGAFENCDGLTTVSLPANLKTICGAAFAYCELTTVDIPEGTKHIGSYAFTINPLSRNEISNSEIILADSIEFIGAYAFDFSNISHISMPSSLECLGTGAFDSCYNLKSVKLNDGLKNIGNEAFQFSRIEEITIPSSVDFIGDDAFHACPVLKNVVFSEDSNLKSIGELAFGFTRINELSIPNSVNYLGPNCFYDCSFLKKIVFPDNLKGIGEYCFGYCTRLSEIVLPQSLCYLGERSLYHTAIESIELPEKLSYIGTLAFEECYNLKSVTLNSISCEAGYGVWYESHNYEYDDFRENKKIELSSFTIGNNVEYLGQYLFSGLMVEEIYINQNVKSIHAKCFEDASVSRLYFNSPECNFIDQENIVKKFKSSPNSFSITISPFHNVEIEQFVFGEAMTCIQDGFLCDAEIVKNVIIPKTIQRIGNGAFYHCYSLNEISIPDSVEYLGLYSFVECKNLKTVNMSEQVTKIEDYSFFGCYRLTDFNWMSDTKIIGIDSFSGCSKLKNFDFENTVFTQGSFSEVAVEELRFGLDENGSKEISIPEGSFMACKSLDMVALGENVFSINSKAFAECENLEAAIIADSVKEIASDAFEGCDNLTIYCNEDSYAQQYAKANEIKVTTLIIDRVPNQTYTGKEITPKLNVHYSGELLIEEKDFSTQYYNNINIGTANAVVSGKGDLRMLISKVDYAIVAVDIGKTQIKKITDQHLSEEPCTPKLKITYNGNELKEGIDYTVSYQNNLQPGTATAEVKGIGNFKGTQIVNFTIVQESSIVSFFKAIWNFIVKIYNMIFN